MKYRITFESGVTGVVGDFEQRHFLRQAVRRQYERTRVRGGWVVTLPGGSLVAVVRESFRGSWT
ncbi:hypothetical protein HEK616_40380 [Streptomyces nigrescens]|uniref:Uncharacterized protein n=1 Tax=Streptomyces nigrescens TaxID=1920 RepID=A0ABM7ZWE5_STRNI|nr:hypothetical protein [Streptomyces nigrescens]BDM70551.1 hypothetical protein HEK616_40380 [Streptomyces nigrescens]